MMKKLIKLNFLITSLLLSAWLAGHGTSNARSCFMTESITAGTSGGQVVAWLQNFSACTSRCQVIKFEVLHVTGVTSKSWTYNPISTCGGGTYNSLKDFFCFNQTDATVLTTVFFQSNTKGYKFGYTIEAKRYHDADDTGRCTLIIDILPALPLKPSSVYSTRTLPLPTRFTAVSEVVASSSLPVPKISSQSISKTTRVAISSKTEVLTPIPRGDALEVTSLSPEDNSASLGSGQDKTVLKCSYRTANYNNKSIIFTWVKDGKVIKHYPGNLTYVQWNTTRSDNTHNYLMLTQYLEVTLSKPEVQGYYNCRLHSGGTIISEGNKTLIWFKDVSTTKYFHQQNSGNSKGIDENTLFLQIRRQLSGNGFKGDEAKLFLSDINRAGDTLIATVYIYFLNVCKSEKLDICKRMLEMKRPFVATNLDCCPSRRATNSPPTGTIEWPVTLHSETAKQKCPYSRKTDNQKAYRNCKANFNIGPTWLRPVTENCPRKSETTKKLKELSEVKISDKNVKNTMQELRNITKSSKKFTDQLDIDFATTTLENAMKIDVFNQTADDIFGTASDLMNSNYSILSQGQLYSNTSSRLLSLISELCDKVKFRGKFRCRQENLAATIETIEEVTIDEGLNITAIHNKTTDFLDVEFHKGAFAGNLAYIHLSSATLRKINSTQNWKNRKISSVAFRNSILFEEGNANETNSKVLTKVDSHVVSVSINGHRISGLKGDEEIQNYFKLSSADLSSSDKRKCVYWNVKARGGLGKWSPKGCTVKGFHNRMLRCSCNHMTNFAILLDVTKKPLSQSETEALSIISYIGCAVSAVSLFVTIVTYLSFRKLRKNLPSRILICLSFSLLATMVIFLGGSLVQSTMSCEVIAVLLHYFVLASFCWMTVEAVNVYRCFVLVFKQASSRFLLKASVFAWGFPLVVVVLTSVISRLKDYAKQNSEGWICIITGVPFYVAYLSPIALVLLINSIVLIITIRTLNNQSAIAVNKRMTGKSKARISATFSALLGCTWIFGLFAIMDLKFTFQILFCVFNSLQGFFIFIFFCVRSEDVREEWTRVLKKFKIGKGTQKHSKINLAFANDFSRESRSELTKELSTSM